MKPINIQYSRKTMIINWCTLITLGLFFVVGLYFLIRSQHIIERVIIGLHLTIFLAVGILVYKLKNRPALELSDEGFKIFAFTKPIPWHEIREVEKGKKFFVKVMKIKLTNPEEILKRRKDLRFLKFCYDVGKNYDLMVGLNGLSIKGDELFKLVSERINK